MDSKKLLAQTQILSDYQLRAKIIGQAAIRLNDTIKSFNPNIFQHQILNTLGKFDRIKSHICNPMYLEMLNRTFNHTPKRSRVKYADEPTEPTPV